VLFDTMRCAVYRPILPVVLLGIMLSGCRDQAPPLVATLTLKADGSHFSGTVLRRESNSITVTNSAGDTHTFLYSELLDIRYGDTGTQPGSSPSAASGAAPATGDMPGGSASNSAPVAATDLIQLPAGTVLQITNDGMLDSSFVPDGAIALARMDEAVKTPDGKVLIPAGASVTLTVRSKRVVDDQVEMEFEVGSADFSNRHYLVASAKGNTSPGAVVTFRGAKRGSPEARLRGLEVHLDDHSLMTFKVETPTVFRISQ
jgi:hypothetical protein